MERRGTAAASRWRPLELGLLLLTAVNCDGGSDPNDPGGSNARITTQEIAEAAFAYLKAAGEDVDQQVATDFSAPLAISGAAGTASVTGEKTASSSSSYSSSSTTRQTDLMIDFADFKSSSSTGSVTGTVRWFDYYYSRTACSDSGCASASDHSEAVEGTSITITFEYDGKTYSDVIAVDAGSGSDSSSWDVELTNAAGESFSFTAY